MKTPGKAVRAFLLIQFIVVLLALSWAATEATKPGTTDPPLPCLDEDLVWQCFDIRPVDVARLIEILEFGGCYDAASAKIAPLTFEAGRVTTYRVVARQIEGCELGD